MARFVEDYGVESPVYIPAPVVVDTKRPTVASPWETAPVPVVQAVTPWSPIGAGTASNGNGFDTSMQLSNLSAAFLQSIGFKGPATVQQGSGESFEEIINPDLKAYLDRNALTVANAGLGDTKNATVYQTFAPTGEAVGVSQVVREANDDVFAVVAVILSAVVGGAIVGAAGAGTTTAGVAATETGAVAIGNGVFLGEGVASGVAAWDAAYIGAGGVLSGASATGIAAADATAGAAPEAGNGAFLGENVASGVTAWDAAATNAGLTLTTTAPPLASAAASSATAPTATSAATTAAPAATTAATTLPTLGQVASGASTLAGIVKTGQQLYNAVVGQPNGNGGNPQTQQAAQASRWLPLLGIGAALFFALKG